MKILSQKSGEHSLVELEIRVEGEEFQKGLDAAYRIVSPKLNLPGFRKGKAPKNLALKTFGIGILFDDAVQETYPAAYEQAITEIGIEPVEFPDVDIKEIDETGYTFTAKVTKKPTVTLGQYRGLTVVKPAVAVEEAEVDEEIESLRSRNARQIDVADRPVEDGDIVIIDYEGKLDNVAFEGGSAPSQQLTIGSHTFIPGFEEQIIGHTPGESFDIKVTFPESYPMEMLAGKETVFSITLHAIKFNELPDVDDEFAKDVSEEYSTVAELRAGLRKALEEYKQQDADRKVEEGLMDQVTANMQAEVPFVMIERQAADMVEDFDKRLQRQGMNIETYTQMLQTDAESFRTSFYKPAERNIRQTLALEEIVKVEDIVVSEEEFTDRVKELAEQIGEVGVENIMDLVDRPGMVRDIAINKAAELIKSTAILVDAVPGEAESAEEPPAETETEAVPKETEAVPKKKAAPKKKADKPQDADVTTEDSDNADNAKDGEKEPE